MTLDLVEQHNPGTGFTFMERLTGGHTALMAGFIARRRIPAGVRTLEQTLPPLDFLNEARQRGFAITEGVDRHAALRCILMNRAGIHPWIPALR